MTLHTRRRFLGTLACAGGALAWPWRPSAAAAVAPGNPAAHAHDWDWLVGNWDVRHRRLKERLVGDTHWEEFAGKSVLWLAIDGLATIDDNIVELPAGTYRGLTVRTYDAASDQWSIWWVDGREPSRIDVPVRGRFELGVGTFLGRASFKDRPILMRFRWRDLHGPRPWWEQAFSADDGKSWEINWRNWFTRTAAEPSGLAASADAPRDFAFLAGRWNVRHRRLRQRLVGSTQWDDFDGTLLNRPVLGGHGNIGDNVMHLPGGTIRGLGLRTFDAASKQWSSWWLDGRSPAAFAAPLRGGFADGVATMLGEDTLEGRAIRTRVVWSEITANSARWEQAASADGGKTWETNWISRFERAM